MITEKENEIVKRLVGESKIFSIDILIKALKCSLRTARRKLTSLQAHTSYNCNGKYYTLPGIPKFDKNGLWKFKNVGFSKYGNLKSTVIRLVNESAFGIQYSDLCELLGVSPDSLRTHFKKIPGLKHGKSGRYSVLFSNDELLYQKQKEYRGVYLSSGTKVLQLEIDEVIILVDRIKNPDSTLEECSQRLRNQGRNIDVSIISKLLSHHDLLKKLRI
jgi:hypothetical protein